MNGLLHGKTALVTGAGRGIGRAIALRLAKDGALVAVHFGASRAGADETVAMIEADRGTAFAVQADITSVAQIEALFATLDSEFLRRCKTKTLDVLVNNAGIAIPDENIGECDVDRILDTNVKGTFFVTQQAATRLAQGGRIINISSIVSDHSEPTFSVYAATKGAIKSLTLSLAAKLGPRGITVNAVQPGATATDLIGGMLQSKDFVNAIKGMTPLGRIGEPSDIANVVGFLASPDAAWITGQTIAASGGMRI